MSYYRDQLEAWLKSINIKTDRVLDVGGASNPVKSRVKSWEVAEYLIFDSQLEKPVVPAQYSGDINISIACNVVVQELTMKPFDIIFCLEVAEYLWDPATAIKNLGFMLKKGGVLYMSFPFVYPVHAPIGHDYLRYTRYGIIKLMEQAGFDNIEIILRKFKKPEHIIEAYKSDGMHIKTDADVSGYLIRAFRK